MFRTLLRARRKRKPVKPNRVRLTLEALNARICPSQITPGSNLIGPTAVSDSYHTLDHGQMMVSTSGVLANDSNPNGGTLTAQVNGNPTHGYLSLNANGSFTYIPNQGFIGTDTFTYQVYDGISLSNPTTVSLRVDLEVTPQLEMIQATEGTPFTDVVAVIQTNLTNPQIGDFSVMIDWGDGSTSPGTIVAGPNGTFHVQGSHAYAEDGVYSMRATVTDRNGNTDVAESMVSVVNEAPNVNAGPNQTVLEGETVNLTGTYTDAGAMDSHTLQWSVQSENGQNIPGGTGANFSFTPNDNGTYWVTFTVSDDDGGWNSTTVMVTVEDVAPVVSLGGADSVDEGVPYTLQLGVGDDPGNDTIRSWTINWGDGTAPQQVSGNPSSVTHTFKGSGSRTIRASAQDEDGMYEAVNTQTVSVINIAPTITLSIAYNHQRFVTLSGMVHDPAPEGLDVIFNGKVQTRTITSADGSFTLTVEANGLGGVYAHVVDGGGLSSNIAQVNVTSNAPVIKEFNTWHESFNTWTITGKVADESMAGLTIVLNGIPSLQGRTITVGVDGTFSLTWELFSPDESGTVTARVTDWWGLESQMVTDIVGPTNL